MHIINCIDEQFSPSSVIAVSVLGLVPSVMCSKDVNLDTAVSKYKDDLPSPELLQMELKRWKKWYMKMPADLRPSSPAKAIKECDRDNIYILLQIACTLPVTLCECERSCSMLRWLNNYMRASMGKNRLSQLTLLHIHYDTPVDLDKGSELLYSTPPPQNWTWISPTLRYLKSLYYMNFIICLFVNICVKVIIIYTEN